MAQSHWSARALMSSSMALGILSLACATSLFRRVSRLQGSLQIRLWLSRGKSKRNYPSPFDMFPLESSVSALQISEIPATLLFLAVILYLIGFGLYLLYSWLYDTAGRGAENRNVFIFFVTTLGLSAGFYQCYSEARDSDNSRTSSDFELIPSEDFVKPRSRKELELMLSALQTVQKLSNEPKDHQQNQRLNKSSRAMRDALQEMQQTKENTRQEHQTASESRLESHRSPIDEERLLSLATALNAFLRAGGSSMPRQEPQADTTGIPNDD